MAVGDQSPMLRNCVSAPQKAQVAFSFFSIYLSVHLAALGLNCSTWDPDFGIRTLSCVWDLVPQPGIEPGPPASGAWSLSRREVPHVFHAHSALD